MGIDACVVWSDTFVQLIVNVVNVEFRNRNAENTLNVSASAVYVRPTVYNTGVLVFVVVDFNDTTVEFTVSCASVGASDTTAPSIRPLHCVLVGRSEVYVLYVVSVESLKTCTFIRLEDLFIRSFALSEDLHTFVIVVYK